MPDKKSALYLAWKIDLYGAMSKKTLKQKTFRIFAIICTAAAFIGALLPVMPTVPFLLAALYFAANDPEIKEFIHNNRFLKKYLDYCQTSRGISPAVTLLALGCMWISLTVSAVLLKSTFWRTILLLTGIAGSACVILLYCKKNKK